MGRRTFDSDEYEREQKEHRNEMERNRDRSYRDGIASLKDLLPSSIHGKRVTEVNTVRETTSYLNFLIGLFKDDLPTIRAEFEKAEELRRQRDEAGKKKKPAVKASPGQLLNEFSAKIKSEPRPETKTRKTIPRIGRNQARTKNEIPNNFSMPVSPVMEAHPVPLDPASISIAPSEPQIPMSPPCNWYAQPVMPWPAEWGMPPPPTPFVHPPMAVQGWDTEYTPNFLQPTPEHEQGQTGPVDQGEDIQEPEAKRARTDDIDINADELLDECNIEQFDEFLHGSDTLESVLDVDDIESSDNLTNLDALSPVSVGRACPSTSSASSENSLGHPFDIFGMSLWPEQTNEGKEFSPVETWPQGDALFNAHRQFQNFTPLTVKHDPRF